jgi:hypothetical protein
VTVMQFGLLYVLSLSGQKKRRKMLLNREQLDPFSLPSVSREKRLGVSGFRKLYVCNTLNHYFAAFQSLISSATGILERYENMGQQCSHMFEVVPGNKMHRKIVIPVSLRWPRDFEAQKG